MISLVGEAVGLGPPSSSQESWRAAPEVVPCGSLGLMVKGDSLWGWTCPHSRLGPESLRGHEQYTRLALDPGAGPLLPA